MHTCSIQIDAREKKKAEQEEKRRPMNTYYSIDIYIRERITKHRNEYVRKTTLRRQRKLTTKQMNISS